MPELNLWFVVIYSNSIPGSDSALNIKVPSSAEVGHLRHLAWVASEPINVKVNEFLLFKACFIFEHFSVVTVLICIS